MKCYGVTIHMKAAYKQNFPMMIFIMLKLLSLWMKSQTVTFPGECISCLKVHI